MLLSSLLFIWWARKRKSPTQLKHPVENTSGTVVAQPETVNMESTIVVHAEMGKLVNDANDAANDSAKIKDTDLQSYDSVHIMDTRQGSIPAQGMQVNNESGTAGNLPVLREKEYSIQSENADDLFKPGPSTEGNMQNISKDNLMKWLTDVVELPQYYETFKKNGLENLALISKLENVDDLEDIGIRMKGHQSIIMNEIKRLKLKSDDLHEKTPFL